MRKQKILSTRNATYLTNCLKNIPSTGWMQSDNLSNNYDNYTTICNATGITIRAPNNFLTCFSRRC